jgi:hypothetical protein
MKTHRTLWDVAGTLLSDTYDVMPGLGSDRATMPADGLTPATLHYLTTDATQLTANWTINGVAHAEPLVNGMNEIQVTALMAGTIAVTCNGQSLSIQAV